VARGAVVKFRKTGLERGAALAKDIAWLQAQARALVQDTCCCAPLHTRLLTWPHPASRRA
jgi:hypothetical protein